MAEEQATAEQKLNIANYFIMSAPPGQVDAVLADVSSLVNDDAVLTNGQIRKMLAAYNKQQYVHVDVGDHKALLADAGVSGDKFIDASTQQLMEVDHADRTAKASGDAPESKVEDYRKELEKEVAAYMSGQYKDGKSLSAVFAAGSELTLCISALNKKLAAMWSGGWRSTFKIDVGKKGSSDMKGHCKIHVHYFEDGNVQLHAEKEKTLAVTVGSPAETAKAIVTALKGYENDYQANIEEMYCDMHETTFKSMRRMLPKTKQPMTWNPAAHSIQSELVKK